ncbi:MAG: hypothetical protein K0S61_4027 [Anaerocolumna sp.]|jgi:hypothetical protein|nr:hypothetical protein [Anaerocolumna sp.]
MAATKSEEIKTEEVEVKMIDITLIKNVKYGDQSYKLGQKIEIKEDDLDEFKKAGVIKVG